MVELVADEVSDENIVGDVVSAGWLVGVLRLFHTKSANSKFDLMAFSITQA